MPTQPQQNNIPQFVYALVLATFILGVSLPWLRASGASLQPGMLDFAEWLTLLPAVRVNLPLLLPSLLTRLAFFGVILLLTLQQQRLEQSIIRVLWWFVIILSTFALLPSVDFFLGQYSDDNYQQQFIIWIASWAGILTISFLQPKGLIYWVCVALTTFVAVIGGSVGLIWGYRILSRYEVHLIIGEGGIVLLVAVLANIALTFLSQTKAGDN